MTVATSVLFSLAPNLAGDERRRHCTQGRRPHATAWPSAARPLAGGLQVGRVGRSSGRRRPLRADAVEHPRRRHRLPARIASCSSPSIRRARHTPAAPGARFSRGCTTPWRRPGVESASLSESPLVAGGRHARASVRMAARHGRKTKPGSTTSARGSSRRWAFPSWRAARRCPDRERTQPVTVVSERFVREFFPNQNPIGRDVRNSNRLFEIIGVCGDVRFTRAARPCRRSSIVISRRPRTSQAR